MSARRFAAAALAAVALLLPSGAAGAAQSGSAARGEVERVSVADQALDVRFRAVDLPPTADLDAGSVTVLLNGQPVPAQAAPVEPEAERALRRSVVVLDTSGSMAEGRLEAAVAAARSYVDAMPADVELALVTFAESTRLVVPPTTDREQLRQALGAVTAGGGTALYDAVLAAKDVLGPDGIRRAVVLSDGADTESRAALPGVVSGLGGTGIAVDAVVLGDEPEAAVVLREITAAAQGQVHLASDGADATSAFRAAAAAFADRLQVHVPVPAELGGRTVALQVSVDSAVGLVVAPATLVDLPGVAGSGRSPLLLAVGAVTLFVGLALLLVGAVQLGDTRASAARRTRAALAAYGVDAVTVPVPVESQRGEGTLARGALQAADRLLGKRGLRERLEPLLDRAAVRVTASEWVVLQVVAAVLGTALAYLLVGRGIGAALTGAVVGMVLPLLVLQVRAKRRAAAFLAAMPDALQLVASGLSSGYSLPQALDAAVREGADPVATEFGRALAEARLGIPMEDALDAVAVRMGSKDFSWVVMAVRIQREVGGNLSEVLETLCQTMRGRQALRRQVAALSAEGRLSAYILIALPVLLGLWLTLARPDYFGVMYTTLWGLVLLAGSAVALVLGAVWMKALVKVEM